MNTEKHITLAGRSFRLSVDYPVIGRAVAGLARRIESDYRGRDPLFLGVLNGAFMFMAELVRGLAAPCEVSFVRVASYRGTASSGCVDEIIGLPDGLAGRDVIVVDDIVDTGASMAYIVSRLSAMGPASVETAALLFKPTAFRGAAAPRYVALEVPDEFVVGFGLDYDGLGRNLNGIYTMVEK